jgi:4-carboxymuconolactone decarboxylase
VSSDEMYQRGEATRKTVLSPDYVAGTVAEQSPILRAFYDYTIRGAWGGVWSRPGLELKYRSLLSICSLAVLNRPYELKIQLRGAINLGWTILELREAFIHLSPYAGSPVTLDALKILDEVVSELLAEGAELVVPDLPRQFQLHAAEVECEHRVVADGQQQVDRLGGAERVLCLRHGPARHLAVRHALLGHLDGDALAVGQPW